ncbi:helix-turn-helix domain-containing protein [Sphingomonas sp. QA11]|uniref:GlxA family transcriptional regulator n=1 Tax=Sphingomonas sp. QA11 TaxID=2950605 RepID=UPI002349C0E5|nr:helix-turn-helix domain-containing protein [Sphingomonas sp. QA11]WCM25973.1 helix-turn-helix domain-containing protein [Sphingomonas sp. QA11]
MTQIRIWAYDGILASGVSGPGDVFAAANHLMGRADARPPIRWRVESPDGRPVRTASGQIIAVDGAIDPIRPAEAILLGAPFVGDMEAFLARTALVESLGAAVRRAHGCRTIIATYCTGAYLLAEAGLLDERVATTHWAWRDDFARRYPRVSLRAQEILTEQDNILCGGAVTSFLMLAIRLVEKLRGQEIAALTARTLLIDTNRVSQLSYASLVAEHGHGDRLVARAEALMEAGLNGEFSLSQLAAELAVSERTLHRRFKQATGRSPLAYLQLLRVELAKRLIAAGQDTIDTIGLRVGYGDVGAFRQVFRRETGLSPRDYQRRFARSILPGAPG